SGSTLLSLPYTTLFRSSAARQFVTGGEPPVLPPLAPSPQGFTVPAASPAARRAPASGRRRRRSRHLRASGRALASLARQELWIGIGGAPVCTPIQAGSC